MKTAVSVARSLAIGMVLPSALILLWQVASSRGWINPLFYPAPWDVLKRTWEQLTDGKLPNDTWATTGRLLCGFVLGAIPGLVVGLAAGVSPLFRQSLYPLATALYVVPRIAMLPLVLVAFGINDEARVFMVAFSVFFIVFFSALSGVEQVERTYIDAARAFGAGRVRLATSVLLPGSAPTVFSGLRVAMGFALIVIVGTEFLAANDGLGARIWQSYQIFDFPTMYSGILAVTVLGVLLAWILLVVEWLAVPWRR
jgi:ABC-type nitrate/sulfonate/bicarbonate transport system permease component